ncbi:hypothetical protein [Cytobacillus oceanisediminis]|uniref:Uncharacterized protein n=1 Tax=Cytobacillus oceanisediminis TaxID=665099 RepID=A0ABX3CJR4_9BACI|nr:hypothetical protein [Cytobacillus oceanisediminis]OHX41321.1 hypothetical protein BBV17_28390 [Cytobacillus oceanisediminis]
MNAAVLANGKVISAFEYQDVKHGHNIYCLDSYCKAPVIFVPAQGSVAPHFKTSGKGKSKHTDNCGLSKKLSFVETIEKCEQYQNDLLAKDMQQIVIKMNLNRIDPDFEAKVVEREQQNKPPQAIKVKNDSSLTPSSISSLKSVVKLIKDHQPDVLASIIIHVKGNKIPLSQLIIKPARTHELLWENKSLEKTPYFVYGTISNFIKREKVYYLNFEEGKNFSLVVFEKYFPHFTYTENQLLGHKVIAYGFLRKNKYNEKKSTEMIIKSSKYIEHLPIVT